MPDDTPADDRNRRKRAVGWGNAPLGMPFFLGLIALGIGLLPLFLPVSHLLGSEAIREGRYSLVALLNGENGLIAVIVAPFFWVPYLLIPGSFWAARRNFRLGAGLAVFSAAAPLVLLYANGFLIGKVWEPELVTGTLGWLLSSVLMSAAWIWGHLTEA